jgi:hypothetical protein
MLATFWSGNFKERRPCGRPKHRWDDNIKIDLREIRLNMCTGFSWLRMGVHGSFCELSNESSGSIKSRNFLTS